MATWLAIPYFMAISGLSLFGFLGLLTFWLYLRHKDDELSLSVRGVEQYPRVTIQLPIYNEGNVIGRLIDSAVALRYPQERLEIQVVDDSNDETTQLASALVEKYRRRGVDISLLHRGERRGFKAGALESALDHATGEYVAIFDADFRPGADFLRNTIPYFLDAPELGLVQTRWGHLNAPHSPLTMVQALALDKHFAVEQVVRFRADLFPKFNGTAGIWRRSCLESVGGWQSDTVCEDLCLSTRAVLGGWRFLFLPHVVAPAELPVSIKAYKSQQARWARGSTQCLRKFAAEILRAEDHSLLARIYALLSMAAYGTSILLILLLLLHSPLLYFDVALPQETIAIGLAGIGQPLLFLIGQRALHADWRRRVWHLPLLLLVAIGLSATISRAVIQGLTDSQGTFVRTPKNGNGQPSFSYRLPFDRIVLVELFLALYAAAGFGLALWQGKPGSLLFLLSCSLGFGSVAFLSLRESWHQG